ncbi:MAG: alkaline phosphatase family protein, partial [SAR202 cluster bacterium]|nr:alkaline phosphatase family protein [SAR202 cluster bacterium]
GLLPNFKRLADNGVMTGSYTSIPAWTPTNWATLITGAHTGTHTVSRWFLNLPGPRDADRTMSAFVGPAVAAQTVFEAADRAGLKSVAVHYPAVSPSRAERAHVIDGFGHPSYGTTPFEVTPALGYTNLKGLPSSYGVELSSASEWRTLPSSQSPPLEFPIQIITKRQGEDLLLWGLVIDTTGAGYDTVAVCRDRDGNTELGRCASGEWSDWVRRPFTIEDGTHEGVFRFKTVELTPDGKRLRLYRSQVMLTDGISEPPELGRELDKKFGPYLEHASVLPYVWGIADLETCMEELDYHCQWLARAGKYLLEDRDYSLLYTHIHLFDYINHYFLSMVDPACPGYDESRAGAGWLAYREAYKLADRLIGSLLDNAPEDTAVIVVSDHAAIPQVRATDIYGLLIDNGYLVLKDSSREFDANEDADNIDMERTQVFVTPVRSYEIFVNALEGSKEYERIQREVLALLRTWTEKATGRCPVALALPKYHAPLLGLWGDQCGDIVFIMDDGYVSGYTSGRPQEGDPYVWEPDQFGAHHGPYLPTARTEVSSNMAFFLGSGPGLKRGYRRPVDRLGYMHHTSVVPIVCNLLGIEPPDQCQGVLPRDFLEGVSSVMERPEALPDWEWGTRVDGWGDRVWTQKRDMFEGFMPGKQT